MFFILLVDCCSSKDSCATVQVCLSGAVVCLSDGPDFSCGHGGCSFPVDGYLMMKVIAIVAQNMTGWR
jgi:hypothetical protein